MGGTPTPSNGGSITRNAGARWFLPNADEWVKAAYFDPVAGIYYDYPTGTNNLPNNNLPSADTGNSANFFADDNTYTTGNANYPLTDVGAYTLSASPYGTFDQGGNVWERNETLYGSDRGLRGGAWDIFPSHLHVAAVGGALNLPSLESRPHTIGFRIATIIPEPSALLLLTFGFLPLLCRRFNPAARRG